MLPLDELPIVDHHAHPLARVAASAGPQNFRRWLTESAEDGIYRHHVPHTLLYRTAVRWLAEALACEPTLEAVLEARAGRSYEAWTRMLFGQANIRALFCDYGYGSELAYSHEEMQRLVPCEVRPILRLEKLAEDLIAAHDTFDAMIAAFAHTVGRARENGYVGLKSIIAYRSGLAVAPPDKRTARRGFQESRAGLAGPVPLRLTDKALGDYLLWLALKEAERQELPVQFHSGFGDKDADLRGANPLHLRLVIERSRAPLVLLHAGWPFYREAAHLAALYTHVWLDLSLAIPLATTGVPAMLRDVLGMAPFSKVMFATDGFTMPEIFWLAARWGRWGLGRVLEEMVDDGFLERSEAMDVARMVLAENALGLYGRG